MKFFTQLPPRADDFIQAMTIQEIRKVLARDLGALGPSVIKTIDREDLRQAVLCAPYLSAWQAATLSSLSGHFREAQQSPPILSSMQAVFFSGNSVLRVAFDRQFPIGRLPERQGDLSRCVREAWFESKRPELRIMDDPLFNYMRRAAIPEGRAERRRLFWDLSRILAGLYDTAEESLAPSELSKVQRATMFLCECVHALPDGLLWGRQKLLGAAREAWRNGPGCDWRRIDDYAGDFLEGGSIPEDVSGRAALFSSLAKILSGLYQVEDRDIERRYCDKIRAAFDFIQMALTEPPPPTDTPEDPPERNRELKIRLKFPGSFDDLERLSLANLTAWTNRIKGEIGSYPDDFSLRFKPAKTGLFLSMALVFGDETEGTGCVTIRFGCKNSGMFRVLSIDGSRLMAAKTREVLQRVANSQERPFLKVNQRAA